MIGSILALRAFLDPRIDSVEYSGILNLGGRFFPWVTPAEFLGKLRGFLVYSGNLISESNR
jgi:hypothetical protein